MQKYVSLIMDIKSSRRYSLEERNKLQTFMLQCMEYMNRAFEKSWEFPVTFSAGDEVQGLFTDLTAAILYLRLFEMMIRPVKVRAGIGVGEWNVKIVNGSSTQQDGPAYHYARKALEEVRRKQLQSYRICSGQNEDMVNYLINASAVLKEQQGYMQNIAQMITELLYPFQKGDLQSYNYEIMKELLNIKYCYKIGFRPSFSRKETFRTSENVTDKLEETQLRVIEPIFVDGENFDSEKVIIKKNMSSSIAEILGCKRQNADMLLKRGHVRTIRNMDYVALQYIEKEYKQYGI